MSQAITPYGSRQIGPQTGPNCSGLYCTRPDCRGLNCPGPHLLEPSLLFHCFDFFLLLWVLSQNNVLSQDKFLPLELVLHMWGFPEKSELWCCWVHIISIPISYIWLFLDFCDLWRTRYVWYLVCPRTGRSSKSKQTIVNTLLFALYGHRGLNANVSYIICLKHRTAKSVLTCVVNVKIGWHWRVGDCLSDLNVNVSTFISSIASLSRLAKSPGLLVDLDDTLTIMMTVVSQSFDFF